jgi:RNA polymerase sigma-70 factor (ECF subfamily)
VTRARVLLEGPALSGPGSREARLDALVAEHFDFIWRQLRHQGLSSHDADDAAQQVFMIATQKFDDIAPGSERSFLYGTALRVSANRRRGVRRDASDDRTIDSLASPSDAPESAADLRRAWALVDELLASLSPELARVLALAEVEELKVSDIAALEGIPAGTAASRLRRAREEFNRLLRASPHKNPFGRGDG